MLSPQQQAQEGLRAIENAILELLQQNAHGLRNSEIARLLEIETGEPGEHRNMLSWSILGRLLRSERIERVEVGKKKLFRLKTAEI